MFVLLCSSRKRAILQQLGMRVDPFKNAYCFFDETKTRSFKSGIYLIFTYEKMVIPICMIGAKKKHMAIYTVITGKYDEPRTNPKDLDIPCILLSNNKETKLHATKAGWHVYDLPPIPDYELDMAAFDDSTRNVWLQRYLKVNPHAVKILLDYEVVIWADGNLEVSIQDIKNVKKFMREDKIADVLRKQHPNPRRKNLVAEELRAIARRASRQRWKSCQESCFKKLKHEMALAGFVDNQLSETNFLVRRNLGSEKMIRFAEDWWRILKMNNCWRDQAGFDYALWRSNISVDTVLFTGRRHWHGIGPKKGFMPDK